jgi:hypothetical protein
LACIIDKKKPSTTSFLDPITNFLFLCLFFLTCRSFKIEFYFWKAHHLHRNTNLNSEFAWYYDLNCFCKINVCLDCLYNEGGHVGETFSKSRESQCQPTQPWLLGQPRKGEVGGIPACYHRQILWSQKNHGLNSNSCFIPFFFLFI